MEVLSDLKRNSRSAFAPFGAALTYTSGKLTGITYDDGSTKTLGYTGDKLTTLVQVRDGVTLTKTFNYTGDELTSIDEVIS